MTYHQTTDPQRAITEQLREMECALRIQADQFHHAGAVETARARCDQANLIDRIVRLVQETYRRCSDVNPNDRIVRLVQETDRRCSDVNPNDRIVRLVQETDRRCSDVNPNQKGT